MSLPRDVSGEQLQRALRRFGYEPVRQRGSHLYMTTQVNGEHHVGVPMHRAIKVGTLSDILKAVGRHHGLVVEELLDQLRL